MTTYRTTTRNQLRTPSGAVGEAPDGPGGMATLSDDIELTLGVGGGETVASYAGLAAIPSGRLFAGKLAYAQDTRIVYRYTGTAWILASARITVTAAQRTAIASAALFEGVYATESDTGDGYLRTGGVWRLWDRGAVTSSTGITPASGWSFTSTKYWVIAGWCYIGFIGSRTGSTLTASGNGSLANTDIAHLSGVVNPTVSGGSWSNCGAGGAGLMQGYFSASTDTAVATVAAGSIASGYGVDAIGQFPLYS